jgi:hypothetical protein
MISPWGMRGKGIGIGRRSLRCLALGSPWTAWRPRRPCGSRPLDKVQKGPRHSPHASHRADLAKPPSYRASLGPEPWRSLAPLGPAATDLPAHPSARGGPRGGRRAATINHSSARGSSSEISFGPGFRPQDFDRQATYAIALLSCAAIAQTDALHRPAMNSLRFIRAKPKVLHVRKLA